MKQLKHWYFTISKNGSDPTELVRQNNGIGFQPKISNPSLGITLIDMSQVEDGCNWFVLSTTKITHNNDSDFCAVPNYGEKTIEIFQTYQGSPAEGYGEACFHVAVESNC